MSQVFHSNSKFLQKASQKSQFLLQLHNTEKNQVISEYYLCYQWISRIFSPFFTPFQNIGDLKIILPFIQFCKLNTSRKIKNQRRSNQTFRVYFLKCQMRSFLVVLQVDFLFFPFQRVSVASTWLIPLPNDQILLTTLCLAELFLTSFSHLNQNLITLCVYLIIIKIKVKSTVQMIQPQQIQLQFENENHVNSLMRPMQVRLKSIGPDTFDMIEVKREMNDLDGQTQVPIPAFDDYSRQGINILSFYKRTTDQKASKIKLAICICAYNQNRSMLQKSLSGIYNSLRQFQAKAGISPNQIVVIVIFDGIQKVNNDPNDKQESIISFCERVDVQNGSYRNKNNEEFNSWRFEEKYKKIEETRKLIEACKPEKRIYDLDKVDKKIKDEYDISRDELLKREYGTKIESDQNFKKAEQDKFDSKTSKRKQTLENVYQKVKNQCQKMLKLREDTSLVYPMKYKPQKLQLIQQQEGVELVNRQNNLDVLLVFKHKNAKKLSSHALFFLGFCHLIKPQICILLDIGLQPLDSSIYNMYKYMVNNPKTGGACGYMGLKVQRSGDEFGKDTKLEKSIDPLSYFFQQSMFDIQKAQRFEYHMGHLIDKPFEALFNFIHVLPGAFSCYRYLSVKNGLAQYLAPALDPGRYRSLEQNNIDLAEDRILSLGLKAAGYSFAYMPDVFAVVDPMKTLYDLIGQRRRWINGSWFAFQNVIQNKNKIESNCTQCQLVYYQVMHGTYFISIGIYFSTIYLTVKSLCMQTITGEDRERSSTIITSIVSFIYIIMVGSLVFLSLNEKSGDSRFQAVYYLVSTLLGIYGIMVLILMIYNLVQGLVNINQPLFGYKTDPPSQPTQQQQILSQITIYTMFGTVAMYAIQVGLGAFFSGCKYAWRIIFEVFLSVPHFLFYAPTYLHNMMIYAFCKIDDFTWGTKGLDQEDKSASFETQKNKIKKYKRVFEFLLWNILIAIVLCILIEYPKPKQYVLVIMGTFFFLNTFFKFILSFCYLFSYCCKNKQQDPDVVKNNRDEAEQVQRVVQRRLSRVGNPNRSIAINQRDHINEANPPPINIAISRSGFIWQN